MKSIRFQLPFASDWECWRCASQICHPKMRIDQSCGTLQNKCMLLLWYPQQFIGESTERCREYQTFYYYNTNASIGKCMRIMTIAHSHCACLSHTELTSLVTRSVLMKRRATHNHDIASYHTQCTDVSRIWLFQSHAFHLAGNMNNVQNTARENKNKEIHCPRFFRAKAQRQYVTRSVFCVIAILETSINLDKFVALLYFYDGNFNLFGGSLPNRTHLSWTGDKR